MNTASEKVVEDILSADKSILADILSLSHLELTQIARQKSLKSGKLDLLCPDKDQLSLVELKTTPSPNAES